MLKDLFLENNDDSDGDETHGDDSDGSYSGTTLLSRSAVIVTALLMAAFFYNFYIECNNVWDLEHDTHKILIRTYVLNK